MFEKWRARRGKTTGPVSAARLLSREEAQEILDRGFARLVARQALERPDLEDVTIRDPHVWLQRARACIGEGRLDRHVARLAYGIFALDRYLALSGTDSAALRAAASEVLAELIKDWRRWKELQKAAGVIVNADVLDELNMQDCLRLLRIQGYRECVDVADTRLGSRVMAPHTWNSRLALVALTKANALAALGRKGDAAQTCEEILTRHPLQVLICLKAGNLLLSELGCFERAITAYQAVVDEQRSSGKVGDETVRALHNQGLAYLRLGEKGKVIAILQECITAGGTGSETTRNARHVLDVLNGKANLSRVGESVQFPLA